MKFPLLRRLFYPALQEQSRAVLIKPGAQLGPFF